MPTLDLLTKKTDYLVSLATSLNVSCLFTHAHNEQVTNIIKTYAMEASSLTHFYCDTVAIAIENALDLAGDYLKGHAPLEDLQEYATVADYYNYVLSVTLDAHMTRF